MSSTHDPYLPELSVFTRRILENALESGVRICIQTRSSLVKKDLDLLREFRDRVRLQVSVATLNRDFAKKIEPRVPPPEARLDVIRQAKRLGITTGVILAPIFPPTSGRPDFVNDLRRMASELLKIQPEHIYGEPLHVRGQNIQLVEREIGEEIFFNQDFQRAAEQAFHMELDAVGLRGTWWK